MPIIQFGRSHDCSNFIMETSIHHTGGTHSEAAYTPYSGLLDMSNRTTLFLARLKGLLVEVFKCIRGLNPEFMNTIFVMDNKPYDTRSGSTISHNRVKTIKYGIQSFAYQGAKCWNLLPTNIKEIADLNEFRRHVSQWNGPVCQWVLCCMYHKGAVNQKLWLILRCFMYYVKFMLVIIYRYSMIYYILHRYYENSFNAWIFVRFNVSDENLCIVCFHSHQLLYFIHHLIFIPCRLIAPAANVYCL